MNITQIERTVLAVMVAATVGAVTFAQGRGARVEQGSSFEVPAQPQWIRTGIAVRQGDTVRFEATGEIALNQSRTLRARSGGAANQLDRAARMPAVPLGALIGAIGSAGRTGSPFLIGDRASVTMPGDGELLLGINDSNFVDDTGAFEVWVEGPADVRGRGNRNQSYDFQVAGQQQWLPTGLIVRQGQVLQLESTGEVTLNQSGSQRTQPRGSASDQRDRAARLPSAPIGSLIGRIGAASQRTNRPFPIGDRTSVTMPGDGELFLGVNDSSFGDNGGAFSVRIDAPDEGRGRGRRRATDNSDVNSGRDFQTRDFQVAARQEWLATGITVRQGDVVRLTTTGEVTLNQERTLRARANGVNNQLDGEARLPNVPVGTLIGRIGPAVTGFGARNNRPFVIGDQTSVSMPADGELFLGINDSNFDDNAGTFTVRIETR
jgi:hypothetical protein